MERHVEIYVSFCMSFGEVINRYAFVAQLAERLICNQNVVGSSPIIRLCNNIESEI